MRKPLVLYIKGCNRETVFTDFHGRKIRMALYLGLIVISGIRVPLEKQQSVISAEYPLFVEP